MIGREPAAIRYHEDPDLFREAVNFTAAETAFAPRLIEKDYFCSLLLDYLAARDGSLTFKGGTCLTKVYAEFYRLSEDLDFAISTEADTTRIQRSRLASGVKGAVAALPRSLPGFRVVEPLEGASNSTQYNGIVAYASLLSQQEETIQIEVGLREPLLLPVVEASAGTILLDPVSRQPMVVVRLVRTKLAVPGNEPVNVTESRLVALRQQLDPQLKPVLREKDFREFDVERAFGVVAEMATRLAA